MPRFVGETRVVQASWWDEKETATIRKLGYGDRQALSAVYVRMEPQDGGGYRKVFDPQLALEKMNVALLELALVRWTDEDGEEMPVTAERIRALSEEDAGFLLAEIADFNPRRTRSAEDQATFRGRGGGGDQER